MFNKKANILNYVFGLLFFNLIWLIGLAKFLTDWGAKSILDNNLVGIEAFAVGNINLIIFIVQILGIIGYNYFGSSR